MHKRHEAEKVSQKFPKENITSAKLQAEWSFGTRAPFAKTFCVKGKAWVSLLIAHMPHHLNIQVIKKEYHEVWHFVTVDKKDDTCVNSEVGSTVVK